MVSHGRDQAGLASPRWTIQQIPPLPCLPNLLIVILSLDEPVKVINDGLFQLLVHGKCVECRWVVEVDWGPYEAPFELHAVIYVSHLLALCHANHHLVIFVHAADSQALLQAGVDACRKVPDAREQQVSHLIWHQLVHHAAHQHQGCCDGCSRGDGLLVGLDDLVGGVRCTFRPSNKEASTQVRSVFISTVRVAELACGESCSLLRPEEDSSTSTEIDKVMERNISVIVPHQNLSNLGRCHHNLLD
ncbi:hypothetical protein EJB05_57569, partial [Eragrostis curvula]